VEFSFSGGFARNNKNLRLRVDRFARFGIIITLTCSKEED
jgi:hypothetical protein